MTKPRKQIQPKPTLYASVQFRSRLEARWAVFLDNQPNVLNWTYEPTTVSITKTGWTYTPDFLVKTFASGKLWVLYLECKPTLPSPGTLDDLRLASEYLDNGLVLLVNPMFGEEADEIIYCLFASGKSYVFEIADLFPEHATALEAAMQYRFDLEKE